MWFFKKIVDVYYIILFEWFEIIFVSGIFNRMVIILIYLLQKNPTANFVYNFSNWEKNVISAQSLPGILIFIF